MRYAKVASGVARCGCGAGNASSRFRLHRLPAAGGGGHAEPPLLVRVGVVAILLEPHARVEHNRTVPPLFRHAGPPQTGWYRHVTNGRFHSLIDVSGAAPANINDFVCLVASKHACLSQSKNMLSPYPSDSNWYLVRKSTLRSPS